MRLLLLILFIFLGASVFAQERLDDLVPYRKGKLWGLVHHDMKEFYKPVFDTIIAETEPDVSPVFNVFRESKGKLVAEVSYKGKKMWLTKDKKLIPFEEEDPDLGIESINMDGMKQEVDADPTPWGQPVVIDSFYSNEARTNKVIVKRLKDSLLFYINNEYLPDFTSNGYNTANYHRSGSPVLILTRGEKFALANMAEKKILTPFEYNKMYRPHPSNLLVISKQELMGVMNYNGKILAPLNYTRLKWIYERPDKSNLFIATKGKKNFFLTTNNTGMLESDMSYDELFPSFEDLHILFNAVKSGKSGIVMENGKQATPFIYDALEADFYSRFLIARSGGKAGFIDTQNNFFTKKPAYAELSAPMKTKFKKDNKDYFLFLARKGNIFFYVDNFGKEFIAN